MMIDTDDPASGWRAAAAKAPTPRPTRYRPVFVPATARSYATVTLAMLARHPQIYGIPALGMFGAPTVARLLAAQMRGRACGATVDAHQLSGVLRAIAQVHHASQAPEAVGCARRRLEQALGELRMGQRQLGGAMRIGVLGPIQLLDGSRTILLAGQRQRALVAALTLDHGKVVPVDRLVDVLWGADPPATARAKVQAHVSALRRVLGYSARPDGGPLLTIPPGYSLTLSGISLDLAEFARLSAQGRQAAWASEWVTASAVFEAALSLWRGEAYADVASHAIRSAAAALDESRLLAVEAKAEADLELGRNETVVAQLYDQVTRHPLRERLRVQLMLALYRRGSRADALAVYRNGRRAMIDELGLEPGLPLRRLHQRMLADESASQLKAASDGRLAGSREPHPPEQRGQAPAAG